MYQSTFQSIKKNLIEPFNSQPRSKKKKKDFQWKENWVQIFSTLLQNASNILVNPKIGIPEHLIFTVLRGNVKETPLGKSFLFLSVNFTLFVNLWKLIVSFVAVNNFCEVY